MTDAIPPQRRARGTGGRKARQPKIKADEKAAIDKTARELAKEINGKIDELKEAKPSVRYNTPEERRKASAAAVKRRQRRLQKAGLPVNVVCKGTTWRGTPCKLAVINKETWIGPNEPTGLYCIHHDPQITRQETDAFLLHGDPTRPLPRRVTPGELAHQLVQRSPLAILEPYLKALGLEMDDESGELVKTKKGLVMHGFSRGGEVIKSPYADLVGQVNIAEKLMDRVYGKARQSVDLASSTTTVAVHIQMTTERVDRVTGVLMQAGVLSSGNDTGQGEVIEGHAETLDS